jgi:hypothetical protein
LLRLAPSAAFLTAFAVVLALPAAGSAQLSLTGGALLSGDDQGFRSHQYRLELRRETPGDGQRLSLRFHTYALEEEIAGVLPFAGQEPAAELSGHVLLGLFWLGAAAGLQGTADLDGATGKLVVARAIPAGSSTFTPRVELAREPLAFSALPLSLALMSYRAEALLAFRAPVVLAEGGLRMDFWEGDTQPGRTRYTALDTIDPTRVTTVHGYALTAWDSWFNLGLAAKAAWSSRNTLLLSALQPPAYTWYPAAAPPFLWETGIAVRASGEVTESLEVSSQLLLPVLSQEVRQWETLRQTAWGTGPFEAKLDVEWWVFSMTAVQLRAQLFAKPWQDWRFFDRTAYRNLTLQLFLEQRI